MFKKKNKNQFKDIRCNTNCFDCCQLHNATPDEFLEFMDFMACDCRLKYDEETFWVDEIAKDKIYDYQHREKAEKGSNSHNIIKLPYGQEEFIYIAYKFNSENFSIGCNSILIKDCIAFDLKGIILDDLAGLLITKTVVIYNKESEYQKKSEEFVGKIKNKNKFGKIYEISRGGGKYLVEPVFREIGTSESEVIRHRGKHAERFKKKHGRIGWVPSLGEYSENDKWKFCISYEKVKLFTCDLHEYIRRFRQKIDIDIIVKILMLVAMETHQHIASQNIAHNDMHPCNILLCLDNADPTKIKEVKITDFDSSEFMDSVVTINWGKYLAFNHLIEDTPHKITKYDDIFGYGCLSIETIYLFLDMENEYKESFHKFWRKPAGRFRENGKYIIEDVSFYKQKLDDFIDQLQERLSGENENKLLAEYFNFLKQLTAIKPQDRPSLKDAYEFQIKWLASHREINQHSDDGSQNNSAQYIANKIT